MIAIRFKTVDEKEEMLNKIKKMKHFIHTLESCIMDDDYDEDYDEDEEPEYRGGRSTRMRGGRYRRTHI